MQSLEGLAAQVLTVKRFPPCLRRSGFAQAGLKLRHQTACPVFQRKWFFVNYDTVSWGEGKSEGGRRDIDV
jgi:hypothetical protein